MVINWRSKFKTGLVPTEQDYQAMIAAIDAVAPQQPTGDTISPYMREALLYSKPELMADLGLPPVFPDPATQPSCKMVKLSGVSTFNGTKVVFSTTFQTHPGYNAKIDAAFSFSIVGVTTPFFMLKVGPVIYNQLLLEVSAMTAKTFQVNLAGQLDYSASQVTISVVASSKFTTTLNPANTTGMLFIQEYA
jgi:hypothetical protein